LRVNPAFLTAVNQLGELADVLYTDGALGMGFELSGKPARDVVQTRFTLDGQSHHYFNQRERWQRFTWPGHGDRPGVQLTWTGLQSGERLYGDYAGNWGLIRLLEQATATPLDHDPGQYRLVIQAPDGVALRWHLRTELGEGPLALLKLRNFTLPKQVLLGGAQGGDA
ncbi:type VI secretion IcmF C-terminal domain-containing protein, partial [Pseudomonas sp. NPDC007930]|uniref:type VI secretion IcmF C-terminal domain-containing protein n=1 Tax=Pseudomonas sp. NPDC007930 TaxID=3364417 RepID=UPI0036E1690F